MNIKHLSVNYKFMTRSINERIYAVIMAGGEGTRFVPYSTPSRPKQFLPVTLSDKTMIQETYERVLLLTPPERCFISTNARYLPLVYEQLPSLPHTNAIGEPLKKNTAPAIALITKLLNLSDPESIAVILPSDHFIERPDILAQCLKEAAHMADSLGKLITLGIKPTYPSTQYGYIKCTSEKTQNAFQVESFVEKPTKDKAQRYIKDGGYYWNSGMFVWRPDVFLPLLEKHAPQIAEPLRELGSEEI
jgi:mannose-1-phosphate guanylyltransferase